jgi:hypothetical protein
MLTKSSLIQIIKPVMMLAIAMWQVPMVQAQCSSVSPAQPVTVDNETTNLPNSRQLVNGTNSTVDTSTPGQVKIDVPAPAIVVNGCRLSLSSSAPVPNSDITSATTVYLLPYKSNIITFDTGSGLVTDSVGTGISASLSGLTAGTVYDVFGYDSAGTPTLTLLAWTNTTTRATALSYDSNGGFLVKSGTTAQRYLGSIYITASGQSEDKAGDRALYNYDNRVNRNLLGVIPVSSWTYSIVTFRAADANTTNGQGRVSFLTGVAEDAASCRYNTNMHCSTANIAIIAVGLNGTTNAAALTQVGASTSAASPNWPVNAYAAVLPPLGYNYFQALESSDGVSCTFEGNFGQDYGLQGTIVN